VRAAETQDYKFMAVFGVVNKRARGDNGISKDFAFVKPQAYQCKPQHSFVSKITSKVSVS